VFPPPQCGGKFKFFLLVQKADTARRLPTFG